MRVMHQFVRGLLLFGLLCTTVLADEDSDFEDDVANEDFDDIPPVQSQDLDGDTVEPLKPLERPEYKKPVASGSVYFTETFDSEAEYKSRWIPSRAKKDNTDDTIAKYDGQWSLEEPKEIALKGDLGLVLKSKAKHHAISAKLDKTIDFTTKSLVFQYEVKFQNGQECGGAYIKLLTADSGLDLTKFVDKTPYTIMFGPDKCGNDYKLHFIFRHKNPLTGAFEEKHAKKPTAALDKYFTDKKSHLYTLVLHNDNSFEIYVDQDLVNSGSLLQDMQPPVNPPKEISDPDDKKPSDWDDRERIPDPDAVKPDDWDETEPEMIADSSAVKPDGWLDDEPELVPDSNSERPQDWDDDMDGEWEPPMINNPKCESAPGCGNWEPPKIKNPKYKGKWSAPMIDNPGYKGKWSPKLIPNPDFFEDKEPYKMTPIGALGLELWSMSDDILFDNFIFTSDKKVADDWADQSWVIKHEQELAGTSSGSGVFDAIMDATRERPWLWIVFAVVIVLPVFMLIVYCCCMPPKKDEVGARKKSDKPTADDAAANDDFEEDEPQPEPEEPAPQDDTPTTRSSKRSPTSNTTTQRKGKSSLNADVSSTSRESGDK